MKQRPFVSYAQNFEDVMLHRALRHVTKGFYVDIGADHPTDLSVTKAFYERHWRGINVEPLASSHAHFVRERPGDVNMRVLAGNRTDHHTFYQFGDRDTGCSTIDPQVVALHASRGETPVREWVVPMTTVDDLCDRYAPPDIHFLKVDVEGAEKLVFEGMTFQRHRPWVILAESTRPGTQASAHYDWEPLLTSREYSFVYADGLNRFYIANERANLRSAFAYPPNVFDGFELSGCRHQCGSRRRGLSRVLSRLSWPDRLTKGWVARPPAAAFSPAAVVAPVHAATDAPAAGDHPHFGEGFVDPDRETLLSLRWIIRHPRAAAGLLSRQPRKVLRFATRQPRRFLFAHG